MLLSIYLLISRSFKYTSSMVYWLHEVDPTLPVAAPPASVRARPCSPQRTPAPAANSGQSEPKLLCIYCGFILLISLTEIFEDNIRDNFSQALGV